MDTRTPIAALMLCALFVTAHCAPPSDSVATTATAPDDVGHAERVWYRTVEIDGLDIFYREAPQIPRRALPFGKSDSDSNG